MRFPPRFIGVCLCQVVAVTISARADDLPVVFVPGLGGTRLVEEKGTKPDLENTIKPGRAVWVVPSLIQAGRIDRMMLKDDGTDLDEFRLMPTDPLATLNLRVSLELQVSAPGITRAEDAYQTEDLFKLSDMPIPVYGDFLGWAQDTWPAGKGGFYVAPYDWRKGAGPESRAALERVIRRAMEESKQSQVVLVAHSLGGIVARDYLCQGENAKKVRALVAVGTAWLGAPKPARGLRYGYCFGLGGRVDPNDKNISKGIFVYIKEDDRYDPVSYLSLISLIDLKKSKDLARTMPCVFQLLPNADYFERFGEELKAGRESPGGSTSVFLGEPVGDTLASFAEANPPLYREAQALRKRLLDGDDRGVRHVLIAGTLDPEIAPEYGMDMQMTDEHNLKLSWLSFTLATGGGFFEDTARNARFFRTDPFKLAAFWDLVKSHRTIDKEVAEAFFKLNPTLRDFGNYNWNMIRFATLQSLRNRKEGPLPVFSDPYIATITDARPAGWEENPVIKRRWGDGAAPLLSATLGYRARTAVGETAHGDHANEYLGKKVEVHVLPLGKAGGKLLEHSRMLDDAEVRKTIINAYAQACGRADAAR